MTTDEIRKTVLNLLTDIAPEIDPDDLDADMGFRDQVDIDSMDLLNFVISIHKEFSIEIPERDYPRLMSVNNCVRYIKAALEADD